MGNFGWRAGPDLLVCTCKARPSPSVLACPSVQGGRDTVHLFMNSRCAGPPCARLRCNLFATQARSSAANLHGLAAPPRCSQPSLMSLLRWPGCCCSKLCRLARLSTPCTRLILTLVSGICAVLQYKLLLSDDLHLEPSSGGSRSGGEQPSAAAGPPARRGEVSRLTSWPAEAAAEAAAAAQRIQQQRLERQSVGGGGGGDSELQLPVNCFAELQYQARVKGFMQPRRRVKRAHPPDGGGGSPQLRALA